VPLEDLEDAARVLQGLVLRGLVGRSLELRAAGLVLQARRELLGVRRLLGPPVVVAALEALVLPGTGVVRGEVPVVAGEQAVEVVGVAVLLADDERRVGVRADVFAEVMSLLRM